MTFHITLAICAFMMVLLGTRIAVLAMRSRRESLGYHTISQEMQKLLPSTIQGGGIVLVFSVIICMSVADIRYGLILSVFLLTSLALTERLVRVPWLLAMLVQAVAIAIPLSSFDTPTFGTLLPRWMDITATAALWLWFINMYSNMDKLDGLSVSGMVSICGGLYIAETISGNFQTLLPAYSLVLAAAGCGFLWWNWVPAKIAFGRVGSIPIGFLLGYLLLLAIHSGLYIPAAILPAYYISESVISWVRRTWHGRRFTHRHDEYYYQQALRAGRSPRFVLQSIFGMNLLLIFLGIYSIIEPELRLFNLLLAYICVFMLLGFFVSSHTRQGGKK